MDSVWSIINKFHKENPKYYYLNIFFIIIVPLLDVIIPSQFQKILNPKGIQSTNNIIKIILIIIIFQVIIRLSSMTNSYQFGILDTMVSKTAIKNILEKNKAIGLNSLSISEKIFEIHKLGDIVLEFFFYIKTDIIPLLVFSLFSSIYFFYIDFKLGLLLLTLIGINILIISKSINNCGKLSEKLRSEYTFINNKVEDKLNNLQIIQTENKNKKEINKINNVFNNVIISHNNHVKCYSKWNMLILIVYFVFLFLIILLSYKLKKSNKIGTGTLIALFFIIRQLTEYQKNISKFIRKFNSNIAALNKLKWLLDLSDIRNIKKDKFNKIKIEFINVSLSYKNRKIIKNMSFNIDYGKKILIKGKIGSGKTSIIKLITGLINPDSGKILINDIPLNNIKDKLLNSTGFMIQNPNLFEDSIINNIKYTKSNISDKKIIHILKKLNLYNNFKNKENGLYTNVGKNGNKLSGGEKQIIFFMRMYIKNPKLIIMDEPTSSLDKKTKNILNKLLKKFMKDKTVIIVSHDDFLIEDMDKIIDLS